MSLEEVLAEIKAVASKVDDLTTDVDALKRREKERERRWSTPSRSRSRSPLRSPSSDPPRRSSGVGRSQLWTDRDLGEGTNEHTSGNYSDEEDGFEGSQLVEVSEKTHRLLTNSCTRSVSNELRKRTRSRFKLPKVDATRTPRVDHVMRTLAPQAAKTADRELARIQSFVLDSLAPVSAMLENSERMTVEDVREASSAAAELIGNANAQLSRLRREKLVSAINKNLTPLVKEDADFTEAAPNLFGPDFSKRAKDYLDQVKTLRSTLPPRHQGGDQFKKPLFRKGHSSGRGSARGRGGGPSYNYRGSHGERQSRH